MKRMLFVVSLAVLIGMASAQGSQQPKFSIALDMPTFSWVSANDDGSVTSLFGFNLALGASYRSYFSPLAENQGAGFWEVGTILLLDPYVGVGYDYRVGKSLYVGASIDMFPIHPFLYGGFGVYYTLIPNLHIGLYLF